MPAKKCYQDHHSPTVVVLVGHGNPEDFPWSLGTLGWEGQCDCGSLGGTWKSRGLSMVPLGLWDVLTGLRDCDGKLGYHSCLPSSPLRRTRLRLPLPSLSSYSSCAVLSCCAFIYGCSYATSILLMMKSFLGEMGSFSSTLHSSLPLPELLASQRG